jgi:hypothetical protein
MVYQTPGDIKRTIAALGPWTLVLTFDVKGAYRTLFARVKDLHAYLVRITTKEFGTEYFGDLCHNFGTKDAEASWQQFMHLLMWLLRFSDDNDLLRIALHYVDNGFIFIPPEMLGKDPRVTAPRAKQQLITFLTKMGIPYHEDEVTFFFKGVGLVWDTGALPSMALRPGKHALGVGLLGHLLDSQTTLTDDLCEQTFSLFSWAATYLTMLSPYLAEARRLHKSSFSAQKTLLFLEAIALLRQALVEIGPDTPLLISPACDATNPPNQVWRSDASTGIGGGAINVTTKQFLHVSHRWPTMSLQKPEGLNDSAVLTWKYARAQDLRLPGSRPTRSTNWKLTLTISCINGSEDMRPTLPLMPLSEI